MTSLFVPTCSQTTCSHFLALCFWRPRGAYHRAKPESYIPELGSYCFLHWRYIEKKESAFSGKVNYLLFCPILHHCSRYSIPLEPPARFRLTLVSCCSSQQTFRSAQSYSHSFATDCRTLRRLTSLSLQLPIWKARMISLTSLIIGEVNEPLEYRNPGEQQALNCCELTYASLFS